MNRFLPALAMTVLFSTLVLAQAEKKPAEKKSGGTVEQTLTDIERKLAAALLNGDAATVEDYLADSWSTITSEGKAQTRTQALEALKKTKVTKSEVSEMKVRMIDSSSAVVTGVWIGAGTDEKGQNFETSERWMDVFANQSGKWKVVASQTTTIRK